ALEGARAEQKLAAREKAKMAAGAVAEVQAYTAELQVLSPASGEVTQVLLQPGELAPQGFPVVTLTDMQDAWALFHVREDQLNRFQPGQAFVARIPALGDESFKFRVSHVAVLGDFATWRTTDSQQGFDMRSFEVEARPVEPIPQLRVGMSVLVELPDA
ncbi:MAG: efflux RND transporter periplasmic adaptor subunit, partial [Aeromonas sp.]|nr:efflux RND transporter periplasmic adaptor subunit [Aeromonas sp.]